MPMASVSKRICERVSEEVSLKTQHTRYTAHEGHVTLVGRGRTSHEAGARHARGGAAITCSPPSKSRIVIGNAGSVRGSPALVSNRRYRLFRLAAEPFFHEIVPKEPPPFVAVHAILSPPHAVTLLGVVSPITRSMLSSRYVVTPSKRI